LVRGKKQKKRAFFSISIRSPTKQKGFPLRTV
jgi:hypothetical protein